MPMVPVERRTVDPPCSAWSVAMGAVRSRRCPPRRSTRRSVCAPSGSGRTAVHHPDRSRGPAPTGRPGGHEDRDAAGHGQGGRAQHPGGEPDGGRGEAHERGVDHRAGHPGGGEEPADRGSPVRVVAPRNRHDHRVHGAEAEARDREEPDLHRPGRTDHRAGDRHGRHEHAHDGIGDGRDAAAEPAGREPAEREAQPEEAEGGRCGGQGLPREERDKPAADTRLRADIAGDGDRKRRERNPQARGHGAAGATRSPIRVACETP